MKKTAKYLTLFIVGGLVYVGVELLWRGRSDWTSFFMGGAALIAAGLLNQGYDWDTPLYQQMTLSGVFITAMEYVVGVLFNRDYHIWDYRDIPFNLGGQICLFYSVLWCVISLLGIFLDDWIRWRFFGEEKPRYKMF